jgi:hypothetical protein
LETASWGRWLRAFGKPLAARPGRADLPAGRQAGREAGLLVAADERPLPWRPEFFLENCAAFGPV